jgi:xanthine dehydrogenase accessory factor
MQREILDELTACLERNELVILATVVDGQGAGRQMLVWPRGETFGDLGSPRLNQRIALFAEQVIQDFQSCRKSFRWDDRDIDVFFDVYTPPAEIVIVGAVHVAAALIDLARVLGYRTVVIDPRTAFATGERFRGADLLLKKWPHEAMQEVELHEASCLVVLSHDMKIDLPALEAGLLSGCRYVGALGSRKTHAKRIEALLEAGFERQAIDRIHSPIGLDLGGRQAEEIALSIMAEMVAVRHGRPTGRGGG